jgi:hypothetical protein
LSSNREISQCQELYVMKTNIKATLSANMAQHSVSFRECLAMC